MSIEYKTVAVGGVTQVKDKGRGRVTAYVSVTGIEDNVKDVIESGAYTKTLKRRIPKGAWGHDWKTPTARTEAADELPPGHPDLPKTLSDGSPWPKEAGALKIDMQFNLKTQRGREAYEDVVFFGDQQEWSIGYKVPPGGSHTKNGVRYIKELDLFEYSPVLFGAMNHARTAPSSVKDAQVQFKAMNGELDQVEDLLLQIKDFRAQMKAELDEASVGEAEDSDAVWDGAEDESDKADGDTDEDEEDDDEEEEEDEDEDEDDESEEDDEKSLLNMLRKNLATMEQVLAVFEVKDDGANDDDGRVAWMEAKAAQHETVLSAFVDMEEDLSAKEAAALQSAAEAFDDAVDAEDGSAVDAAGSDLLDVLEGMLENEPDDELVGKIEVLSRVVADRSEEVFGTATSRQFGEPSGQWGEEGMKSYVDGLDEDVLVLLKSYVDGSDDDIVSIVDDAMESKMGYGRRVRTSAGARRHGRPAGAAIGKQKRPGHVEDEGMRPRKRRNGRIGTGMKDGANTEVKKTFSTGKRRKLADTGAAMPDGSFPIENASDLGNAVSAYGRAGDKVAAKKHIKKRAKALGLTDKLPDDWKAANTGKGAPIYQKLDEIDAVQLKGLLDIMDTLNVDDVD